MAASGHQTGESQHDQQHSWQDGDHARRPQGYSLRTVVLLHAKGGWVSGSGRVPVITLPLEDEGGGPPLVGQQVMSRCYWHVLATVQRPPPVPGRLPGASLVYDPAPHDPGAGPVLPRFGCICSGRTCAEEALDPNVATLLNPSGSRARPSQAPPDHGHNHGERTPSHRQDPVVRIAETRRIDACGPPARIAARRTFSGRHGRTLRIAALTVTALRVM
jgi:hypothetical protein